MVNYDVTSCPEEPLWQVMVPGISVPVSTSDEACACSAPGSKIILTTNEGLRQVLVELCIYAVTFISYRFICSWHVMKCCVKTIPETGSCYPAHFSETETVHYSPIKYKITVVRLWPGVLSLKCHRCTVEANSRCTRAWIYTEKIQIYVSSSTLNQALKIWPEPDLDGFVKKGQMPGAEVRYVMFTLFMFTSVTSPMSSRYYTAWLLLPERVNFKLAL